ncbi:MAG: anaerobic carbon-monoxide dehydrogenase catalytic subunit [Clostridiales bacterium]|jgi:carbon-monoxide dehydrogenase catalytic subunit|nr:anaerobic carbon-monoxide dehydrogenase catalytic subunit [Clostridiales bacterium]
MNRNVSIDPAVLKMLPVAREEGIETAWDRHDAQQPQCGFGLTGLCCRHCLQGPCRIDPFGDGGPQTGICGAGPDLFVARNLLRQVAAGAASHVDHAYEAVEALLLAAEGKAPYELQDSKKLRQVAGKLGIPTEDKDDRSLAKELADAIFTDFANHSGETMHYLTATAPAERVETWRNLGVLPRNPDREIRQAMHQTSMGMDADPVNLILSTVRQGLVDGYAGLHLATDVQDILFGTPQPVVTEANLGVLKEDYVNIIVHGHVPLLSEKVVEWARTLEDEAVAAGAKGIQLAGICCTGNEVLMRQGVPPATNGLAQELAVITGAADAVIVDVQCIMPSLGPVTRCYHTALITTMPIVKIPGAIHVDFTLEKADEAAQQIIHTAINAYKKRDKSRVRIPAEKTPMIAGFSVEAIIGALSKVNPENPLKPLVDNIVAGNILGAVGTVGCSNSKLPHDLLHVEMVRELVKENVLVVATGCSALALAKAGFMAPDAAERFAGEPLKAVLSAVGEAAGLGCPLPPVLHMGSCVDNSRIGELVYALAAYLNVPIKALPVVASAPEPMHEKALSIGTWAVSLGLLTHLGVVPPVLGGPQVTEILTSQPVVDLLGGRFYVESDPHKAVGTILEHIRAKRSELGI